MKIIVNNKMLDAIKSEALVLYRENNNRAIESEYYETLAYITAFTNYCARLEKTIALEIPELKAYEVID